jgi:hypothetical protein
MLMIYGRRFKYIVNTAAESVVRKVTKVKKINFIIDLFINNHAIVSSVFGIGQIIAYLVHYHMFVFCYVNAVVG